MIKTQTSQPVQGKPVERLGCNSDTTLVQCRKSLFLEGLSNRADTMAGNGGCREHWMEWIQIFKGCKWDKTVDLHNMVTDIKKLQ